MSVVFLSSLQYMVGRYLPRVDEIVSFFSAEEKKKKQLFILNNNRGISSLKSSVKLLTLYWQ
jgi:hypothetical protein